MRIILAVSFIVALGACRSAPVNVSGGASGSATGAATAQGALDSFFKAINSGDLQAVTTMYGTERGAVRDVAERDDQRRALERKLVILECHLRHDSYNVVSTPRQRSDTVIYKVQLTKGSLRGETDVTTVKGPRSRWYVSDPRIDKLGPFCATDD